MVVTTRWSRVIGSAAVSCDSVDHCDGNELLFHRHDQILRFASPGRGTDVMVGWY